MEAKLKKTALNLYYLGLSCFEIKNELKKIAPKKAEIKISFKNDFEIFLIDKDSKILLFSCKKDYILNR